MTGGDIRDLVPDPFNAAVLTATFAMGWFFGSQYAGRMATGPYIVGPEPQWMQQVKTVNTIALAVVTIGLLGAVALDYLQRGNTDE